jgi:geranylgeranyl diphosphate synthase type I
VHAGNDAFGRFVARVRVEVDSRLAPWLDAHVEAARARGNEVGLVADAVRSLVMRGGKRMRAVLVAAAYEACAGEGGSAAVAGAGASLELLQAYLLVHDDWMDGDDVRRGGPSVPAMLRARMPAHGDAASVLAGDLAAAWSQEALLELDRPPEHVVQAARELARMQDEVVSGQLLDVISNPRNASDVERTHALKTASYSVRGPVVMGARLAGAAEARVAALEAYGLPLGIAFQLRDDVLGAFGDEHATGKPSGADLRRGKRTALVVEASRDGRAADALARVLGRVDATDADVTAAVRALEESGARRRVEERISTLVEEARAALGRVDFAAEGRSWLEGAIAALTERER